MFMMPGCSWLSIIITITIFLSCSLGTAWYFWGPPSKKSLLSSFMLFACGGGGGCGVGVLAPSILLKYPFPAFQSFQTLTRNHSLMTPEKSIYPFNIQWYHDSDWAVCVYDIKYLNIYSRLLLTSLVVWAALLSLCTVSERVKSLSMYLGTYSFVQIHLYKNETCV